MAIKFNFSHMFSLKFKKHSFQGEFYDDWLIKNLKNEDATLINESSRQLRQTTHDRHDNKFNLKDANFIDGH